MAEYQRHPLARPHDVGQDFWAAGYAGPSLWDRQKYIDPRTGQVWESLEEALRFLSEHTMPDITARDVNLPPGPPGEAAFRISQEVPTILQRPPGPAPVVTAVPEVSSGVPVQRDDISNWRVNQEHELRKAIEREETEPQLQNIKTSMLSRLIPSAQASDLAPLPPPPTREELVDRGLALQELLALEEASSGPTTLRQPQIGPTQLEQPQIGPSVLRRPSIPTELPGGKIVDGKLVLDESREAWKEFMRRESREIEPSLLDGPERPELLNLWDSIEEAGSKIKEVATNLWDYMPSPISASEASSSDVDLFNNWEKNYWAKGKKASNKFKTDAFETFSLYNSGKITIPKIAKDAIDIAVEVFGTDYGKDGKARNKRYGEENLRKDLERIGLIESARYATVLPYNTKSTDSGYWQVKASTAKDSLEKAPQHFGERFDKEFGPKWSHDKLLKMSEDELKDLMRVEKERNQALAASFAAVKILQTFDY